LAGGMWKLYANAGGKWQIQHQPLLVQYKQQAYPPIINHNYTPLVISRNDKNKQLTLLKIFINNNNSGEVESLDLCSEIERVTDGTIKFLGVNFDQSLSFQPDIKTILSKISRSLYAIQRPKIF
jgi:hypothetical protein